MKKFTSALLLSTAVIWSAAQAQESAVAEYAEPLRWAAATHLLGLQLQALADYGLDTHSILDDDEAEQDQDQLLALFAGSLAAADADLLQKVKADIGDVRSLAAEGSDEAALAQAVTQAQDNLASVRTLLIANALIRDSTFQAALIAELANSDFGVGEAYEDAAEGELEAYPMAWLTLQRVDQLWAELASELPAASEEMERALGELHALMPTQQPPKAFSDPEDAEGAALDIVFALENALGRPLLIRGFKPALSLMQRQGAAACEAAQQDQEILMLEQALAARITYKAHVRSTLATLAPEIDDDLDALWKQLQALRTGDGDEICTALQDALQRARDIFD